MKKTINLKANITLGLIFAFLVNMFGPLPKAQAQEFSLPAPGVMVYLSPRYDPPILKGIKVHPGNPFRFDFILDKGESKISNDQLKDESRKLIKYFLASLTIPEKDLWVNLSPYEKDRIIPNSFGLTEMGRDLLAEDYMLKQITASLIYPENAIGKKFWKRIYEETFKKYGTTNIPVNTFNKVWIVPEKAVVYENAKAGTAYVVESRLKVMLEEDYLSLEKHLGSGTPRQTSQLGSQIVREIVIPELTEEINENKNFIQLRQVYNSLILATWYKKKIKDSILGQVYADKNKVAGVNVDDPKEKEKIYQRYLMAFKKGVYNYIKEEQDAKTQQFFQRKYFSGGASLYGVSNILTDGAMIESFKPGRDVVAEVKLADAAQTSDPFIQSILDQPLNITSATVKSLENLTPRLNDNFLKKIGWDNITQQDLDGWAENYELPTEVAQHFKMELRLFSFRADLRPHVILLGAFVDKQTAVPAGFFLVKISTPNGIEFNVHSGGFFTNLGEERLRNISVSYNAFLQSIYRTLKIKINQETLRANFIGRYLWGRPENGGYQFLDDFRNYGQEVNGGQLLFIDELARRNLVRFLKKHFINIEDLELDGRPVASLNELIQPGQFAALKVRYGLKVTIAPLIGQDTLGPRIAMDVGKAFMLADYRSTQEGVIKIGSQEFSAEAMPPWLGVKKLLHPQPALEAKQNFDYSDDFEEEPNENPINLVFAGRVEPAKGVAGFVKLVAYAQRRYGSRIRAYVLGEVSDAYRNNLETLAEQDGAVHLDISGIYDSQGFIETIGAMDRWNTIVVHSYGLVTKEFMAMGLPIISSDGQVDSGTYRLYTNGGAPTFNNSVYERALDDLIDHPEKRVELATRAREIAVERYGSKGWMKDLIRVIHWVIGHDVGERFIANMTFSGFGYKEGGLRKFYHNLFIYLKQQGIKTNISAFSLEQQRFMSAEFPPFIYVPGIFEEDNFHEINTYQQHVGTQSEGELPSDEDIRGSFLPALNRLLKSVSLVDVDMENIFKVSQNSSHITEEAVDAMAELQNFFVKNDFDVDGTMQNHLVRETVAEMFQGDPQERLAQADQILYDEQPKASYHFWKLRTLMTMLSIKMPPGKDISLTLMIWPPIINIIHKKNGGPPVIFIEHTVYGITDRGLLKDIESEKNYSPAVRKYMQQYLALMKMIMVHNVDGYINPWNGEKLKQLYGDFFRGKGVLLPHAVDTDLFSPSDNGEDPHLSRPTEKIPLVSAAMTVTKTGGIDFTRNKTPLEIKNSGLGIKFYIDPAQLAQLQNAPGFVPLIIDIYSLDNLRHFLSTPV